MKAILLLAAALLHYSVAFQPSLNRSQKRRPLNNNNNESRDYTGILRHAKATKTMDNNNKKADDDSGIQWELLKKHHARGSWKGIWTTYDYIGDVAMETVASVDCVLQTDDGSNSSEVVDVSHNIVVGAQRSDCATCFDTMEAKTIPVATYTPDSFQARKTRLGACGMVVGPSLLRSGSSK